MYTYVNVFTCVYMCICIRLYTYGGSFRATVEASTQAMSYPSLDPPYCG